VKSRLAREPGMSPAAWFMLGALLAHEEKQMDVELDSPG
jgi:hypothetical protein